MSTTARGSYPEPAIRAVPTGVHAATTCISLRVRVPVLSVQTNVIDPRVSTASSRRTSAWRRAMRCAPIASDSVTVGRRPSGTSATVTPIANTTASLAFVPVADNGDPLGQQVAQPFGRPVSAVLLDEREHRVDDDHHHDRDAQLGQVGDERQHGPVCQADVRHRL